MKTKNKNKNIKNIKVDTKNAGLPLSQKEYNRLVNDPDVINLSNRRTTDQIKESISNRKQFTFFKRLFNKTIMPLFLFVLMIILIGFNCSESVSKVDAYNNIPNTPEMTAQDVKTNVRYGKYNQLVTAYKSQIEEMQARGYSDTRILDLLALKSMECNRYDGLCYGHYNLDLGPFQINKIHKDAWVTSGKLMSSGQLEGLFKFQLTYANDLVQSYEDRFCGEKHFKAIGRKFTNERRFKCIAKSYNGSPRYKYTYAELGWLKRQIISDILFNK